MLCCILHYTRLSAHHACWTPFLILLCLVLPTLPIENSVWSTRIVTVTDSNHSYFHLTLVTPCKKKKKILLRLAAFKAQAISFLHSWLDKFMNCCTFTSLVHSSRKKCCDEARNLDPQTWLAFCCHSSCVTLRHGGQFLKKTSRLFPGTRQWNLSRNYQLWNCVADSSLLASHEATTFVCLSVSLSLFLPSPPRLFFSFMASMSSQTAFSGNTCLTQDG